VGTFSLQLRQFAEKAAENADEAIKNVALDVFQRVVVRSPVDTGRFRANWRLSVGAQDLTTSESVVGQAPTLPDKVAGSVLWISNNLPYARPLEYGHSNQAPNGMVRLTVAEFGSIVDQAAAETTR
jgi:hypothetical protein